MYGLGGLLLPAKRRLLPANLSALLYQKSRRLSTSHRGPIFLDLIFRRLSGAAFDGNAVCPMVRCNADLFAVAEDDFGVRIADIRNDLCLHDVLLYWFDLHEAGFRITDCLPFCKHFHRCGVLIPHQALENDSALFALDKHWFV